MSFGITTPYGLKKPDVNTELDSWGDDLNDNWDAVNAGMVTNRDAAAAANAALAGKANVSHTHAFTDITGTATTAQHADGSITNNKLANMAANTIKGVVVAGIPSDLSGSQVAGIVSPFLAAASVGDNSITNAKLTDMAVNTIKGRVTAGTGDPEDLTAVQTMGVLGAASLAGPTTFTGVGANAPRAETAAPGTNTTQLATTAFVTAAIAGGTGTGGGIITKGASATLALTDINNLVAMDVGTANTLTIPPDSTAIPVNSEVDVVQHGAGQTTIVAGSGVTLRASGSKLKLTSQYSGATIKKRGANDWYVWGDLSA